MKHFQLLATALLALLVDVDGCTTDSSYTVEARTTSTVKVCTQLRIPLSITSTAIGFVFPPLRDNKDASNFAFNTFLRRNPPLPTVNGSETISATYTIDAEFCTPLIPTARSTTLHLLTPGIGFDKSYVLTLCTYWRVIYKGIVAKVPTALLYQACMQFEGFFAGRL